MISKEYVKGNIGFCEDTEYGLLTQTAWVQVGRGENLLPKSRKTSKAWAGMIKSVHYEYYSLKIDIIINNIFRI